MAGRPLPWGGLIVSLGLGPPCDPFRQTGKRPGNPETHRTLRRSQPTVNPGCAHEAGQGRGAARPFPVPGGIGGIASWRKRVERRAEKNPLCTSRPTNRVLVHVVVDQFARCWLCPVRFKRSE